VSIIDARMMCGAIIGVIFERGGRRPCARVNPAPR
jgi:hypothetical protein